MLSLVNQTGRRQLLPMTVEDDDQAELKLLGRALASLRLSRGVSQAAAGEAFGTSGQGWGKYENGKAPSLFKPRVQKRLAEAIGATLEELTNEAAKLSGVADALTPLADSRDMLDEGAMLELRDRVQASAWLRADDTSQVGSIRYPLARDPRYLYAHQWLSEVVGDSVDQLKIFNGDLVHCVDLVGSGLAAKTGDIVEVERLRFDGAERELTLKQIEITPAGYILWPRSSNPLWRDPLDLRDGAEQDDSVEVRIRGLVVAAIRRF